jgi:regulatory protein
VNELRQLALKLLARREHSRAELARKLSAHGSAEEIDPLLDQLQQSGLLSDTRFAETVVRAQAPRSGTARMRQLLRSKGVAGETIDATIAAAGLPDEMERARAVWQRKFAAPPHDAREWARQARFLQARGFAADLIRRLLKEREE